MTASSATTMKRMKETEIARCDSEAIFDEFSDTYDLIAKRAFELSESRGASPGHEMGDWLRAESELLHLLPLNLIESDDEYIAQAEVPGFCRLDIEIGVEPRRLVISGKRERRQWRENARLIRTEFCADRVLRIVDLPSDIDTSKVSTALEYGFLTVYLPKAREKKC